MLFLGIICTHKIFLRCHQMLC